jgi:predicted AAA+ superfamily ATPase
MIKRTIQSKIEAKLFQERIIVIYGTRRVGKTTLGKAILKKYDDSLYLNCDEIDIRDALTHKTSTELLRFIGKRKIILIDEAQRVPDIGITLKLLVDTVPDMQIIATWSSSFDLANRISEPLTGRKYEFFLFPLSLEEIVDSSSQIEARRLIDDFLIYGTYPMIYTDQRERVARLKELIGGYLFHDILSYETFRRPELLDRILKALALQIWSEVSYTEIANLVWTDKNTVSRYIELLEKTFVIFRLPSFARNLRNELKKAQKIYFVDLWIRNALLGNFTPIDARTDIWALWENFCILERRKYIHNHEIHANMYFWRTQSQQEIDYIEEVNGELQAFEYKYRNPKVKLPKSFADAYSINNLTVLTRENILETYI